MPQVPILTTTGQKSGTINLPDQLFAAKINPTLMAQAVRVYLANQRQSPAKTKGRSEVRISKRKIWRQKGTGRARHGARSAPIFTGGGRAHGPTGQQNYKLRFSKKMRTRALSSALTSKFNDHKILIVKDLDKLKPKTQPAATVIKNLKLENKKTTLILPQVLDSLILATRNIPSISTIQANLLNTYQVLNTDTLIFFPESIEKLKETFLKEKSTLPSSPSPKPTTPKKPSVKSINTKK